MSGRESSRDGSTNAGTDFSRLGLEEFSRQVPPGWKPGVKRYTFKTYMQKLRLWWRFAEVAEHQAGPLIAARLGGLAFKRALTLRLVRDGELYVGEAAIALPRVDATTDPHTGQITEEQKSGAAELIKLLQASFEQHDHDGMVDSLDKFFDHRRGHSDLVTYCTEYVMYLEDAEEKAGLGLNNVAKAHLFLKNSGLSDRKVEDIRLKFGGNLDDYEGILSLVTRLAKSEAHERGTYFGDAGGWDDEWGEGQYDENVDEYYGWYDDWGTYHEYTDAEWAEWQEAEGEEGEE